MDSHRANPVAQAQALPGRSELEERTTRVIHPGSATKSCVRVVRGAAGPIIVKDARPQHALIRGIVGRRMLRREARVLQHVQGVPGVPAFLGWIDRDAIAEECMPGSPMVRRKLDARTSRLVMRASRDLLRKVEQLHERRVVHLDLRQYRNILVDRSGAVSLVDFESALVLGRAPWGRLLFWLGRRLDRGACLKFKAKFGFALLTEEERRRYRRHELLSKLWVFHRFGPFFRWLFRQGSRGDPPPSADRPA